MKIVFPPRPKGKMLPSELPFYENTGKWLAQRKFRGSRAVIHISPERKITLGNRHGKEFARFTLSNSAREEILSGLELAKNTEYWLDGELMNKDLNSTNEIILYDVLQAGRYLFGNPTQAIRLEILNEICRKPKVHCRSGIALEVTEHIWMAESFDRNFAELFAQSLPIQQLEGLVLRKKASAIDNYGFKEYETGNLIRCRKSFAVETPKPLRSGGYEF